jgi:helicase
LSNQLTIPSRKYFIAIDKSDKGEKKFLYDINFFYIKSFKKKRVNLSYLKKPFFKGTVLIGLNVKNKMRPIKFNKFDDGTLLPINPRLFKKLILSDELMFIAFSSQTDPKEFAPIVEMLENLQFDMKKTRKLTFCESCLEKKKFNFLTTGLQIRSYKNEIICSQCALETVLSNLKLTGLISPGKKINPKLKNFFTHMILKFRDVKKVLSAFQTDFNPVKNRKVTIYDIEKNPPINKKYLNYKIEDLNIQNSFKDVLKNLQISTLLPIQAISIEKGLLSKENNQLLMAPTSGGKTLVGELAGVSKLLNNRGQKMLYLVPIVALANIRTEEFKSKYKSLNLKIIKKVGESFLTNKEDFIEEDLINADIIIATYEAIDFILRSGNKAQLGSIATIVVDEIQVLIDSERGYLLDGFIARLKSIFKDAQFLYLSATVGEPELLAKKLNCSLIRYTNRPVPIERHLVLCLNEIMKHKNIVKLVRSAFSKKSKYGFRGQTIVFTNTRKKCEAITAYLGNRGIKVRAYHSGLTNEERKVIEQEFLSQKIAGVVATAALAAGVDLPASQVIFESLAMGINWLTVAEFEQMLGRAGRLKKHDLGLAYLLVEPGKIYSPKMTETEENIAIKLLNGKIRDFELEPNENKSLTELLAFVSMFSQGVEKADIYNFYRLIINNNYDIEVLNNKLKKLNLIKIKNNLMHKSTHLGQAIAKSFLSVDEGLEIIDKIQNHRMENILQLALELQPIKNVYLSKKIVAELAKNVRMKYLSNNFFSASALSLMRADYVKKKRGNYSRDFIELMMKWINKIFNCNCKENPYCDCGRINLEKIIYDLRTSKKFSIEQISEYLKDEYELVVFKGDLIDYLESLIYSLESIKNISEGVINLAPDYREEILKIPSLIENIKT